MAIPLVGSPAPAPRPLGKSLITGDSSTFSASLGSWTAYGASVTATRESGATSGYPATAEPNMEIATTGGAGYDADVAPNAGVSLRVQPPGGFKTGQMYVVEMWIACEQNAATWSSFLYLALKPSAGAIPTNVQSSWGPYKALSPYWWERFRMKWIPTADCAYVDLKLGRVDSEAAHANTYHVAGGTSGPKMYQVDTVPIGDPSPVHAEIVTGRIMLSHNHLDASLNVPVPAITIAEDSVDLYAGDDAVTSAGAEIYLSQNGNISLWAPHGGHGDLLGEGLNFEVQTDDWIGVYMSGLDADTVQIYSDVSSGGYVQLRHRGSKGWAVAGDDLVNTRIEAYFEWRFTKAGTVGVATNVAEYHRTGLKCIIDEVFARLGTAPTGQAAIIDVNDDGTTIFTTQANRPTIADGTNTDVSGVPDGGTAVAAGSIISVDVDQVGSGTAGADLTVFVRGRYIW